MGAPGLAYSSAPRLCLFSAPRRRALAARAPAGGWVMAVICRTAARVLGNSASQLGVVRARRFVGAGIARASLAREDLASGGWLLAAMGLQDPATQPRHSPRFFIAGLELDAGHRKLGRADRLRTDRLPAHSQRVTSSRSGAAPTTRGTHALRPDVPGGRMEQRQSTRLWGRRRTSHRPHCLGPFGPPGLPRPAGEPPEPGLAGAGLFPNPRARVARARPSLLGVPQSFCAPPGAAAGGVELE